MTSSGRLRSVAFRHSAIGIVAAAIGVGLLVATVRQVGWPEIRAGVGAVGGWFAVVVLLGGARFLARSRSWVACTNAIGTPGLTTRRAFGAVIAGDAVGNVTPLGLLASEPTKVLLVRDILPTAPALTSVALDNAFYTASVVMMVAMGAWVLVRQAALPGPLRLAAETVLATVVLATIGAALLARRKPAIVSRLAAVAARVSGRAARSPEILHDIEARFYGVLGWPAATLWRVGAWQTLFHALAVAEVWLILLLLSAGRATLADAFVLESTGRLVTVVFKVVPFRMGVDEAGAAVVAGALGVPVSHGVTLALVRKLRILVWNAAGLVVLARGRR